MHLVTGATGFVGAALVLELLEQSSEEIACLVRPSGDGERAATRLGESLRRACAAYGRSELLTHVEQRCRAVPFELGESSAAVLRRMPGGVAEVWHAAASLRFKPAQRRQILERNVEGTRGMLEIATRAGASAFNYISTAYVAGTRNGVLLEQPASDPSVATNAYEESKIRAEMLVGEWEDVRTRILRPSVVIGHSRTHGTMSNAGLYSFVLGVRRVQRDVRTQRLGEFLAYRPIRLRGDGRASINLVPVDVVARNCVQISRSDSDARIFHLVNATPPTAEEVGRVVFDALGMAPPRWVDDAEELTLIDERLDEDPRARFFRSSLSRDRVFDLANTNAALGETASVVPLGGGALKPYVDRYVRLVEDVLGEREQHVRGDFAARR